MGGSWYWARAELRRRWRSWLAVAVLVGIGGGLAMGALAGARRTHTAHPRFLEWADAPDLVVEGGDLVGRGTEAFLDGLLEVPGVAARTDARAVALGEAVDGRIDPGSVGGAIASVDGVRFYERDRVLVTEGRLPDPARADEVLVSESVAIEGVEVGDRLDLRALGADALFEAFEAGSAAIPADLGMLVPATVTGVGIFSEQAVIESELAQDQTLVTPALFRRLPADALLWDRTGVHLEDGADPTEVRRRIQQLAVDLGGEALFEVRADISARAQRAVRPYVLALAGLGAAGTAFVVLLALQLVRRLSAQRATELGVLRALGAGRPGAVLGSALPAAATGAVAVVVAQVVAVALSAWTPVGPVRSLEAGPRVALDWVVAAPGGALLLAAVLVPALLEARRHRPSPAARGLLASWTHQGGAPVPVLLGVGSATGAGDRGRSRAARAGLVTVALAVGMVVAVATFAASLTRVLDEPEIHGWNVDAALLAQDGYGTFDVRAAGEVDGVRDLAGAVFGSITVGDVDVAGMGIVQVRGAWAPPVVEGSAPVGEGELLLGVRTATRLGAAIGDTVDVRLPGEDEASRLRVAGTAVFPGLGQLDNDRPTLGDGALVVLPPTALDEIADGWSALFADLEPGADRDAVIDDLVAASDEVLDDTEVFDVVRPADIAAFSRLGAVPVALLLLFGVVALGSLAHVLVVGARGLRRDRAVLAALGATPRQLRAASRWQALTVVGVALVVAVPGGIALGRWSWRSLAVEIGIVPDPVLPVGALAALVAALLVAGALATALPERIHAGARPAHDLRTE